MDISYRERRASAGASDPSGRPRATRHNRFALIGAGKSATKITFINDSGRAQGDHAVVSTWPGRWAQEFYVYSLTIDCDGANHSIYSTSDQTYVKIAGITARATIAWVQEVRVTNPAAKGVDSMGQPAEVFPIFLCTKNPKLRNTMGSNIDVSYCEVDHLQAKNSGYAIGINVTSTEVPRRFSWVKWEDRS